jgi:thiol-disulfide isomerase/thioredoxin
MSFKSIAILVLGMVILVGGATYFVSNRSSQYDELATCIKDKGAIFWGAFWCPHCREQKDNFGNSARLLPYTECSTPDGQGQTQQCTDAGIRSYPTWDFKTASGTERVSRVLTPQELAEKTGCMMPVAK